MTLDELNEKQAFKLGFITYCANNNLPAREAAHLLKKVAKWPSPVEVTGSVLDMGNLALVGIPAGVGLALGGGLGYGAAKLDEPSVTPDDIKAQELAKTYKRFTDRIKARRAYQQYRAARQMA